MNTIFLTQKTKEMARFVTRHSLVFSAFVFFVLFSFAVKVFATPPTSTYTVGETLNPTCAPGSTNCSVSTLPEQTGNSGKFLTTDGTSVSWGTVVAPSWGIISGTLSDQTDLQDALDTKGTFTLPSLTTGSVLFSDGTTIVEDNSNFFYNSITHKLGLGTTSPAAYLSVLGTTEQMRLGYDVSNYFSTTVASNGVSTFDAVGTAPKFVFSDNVDINGASLTMNSGYIWGVAEFHVYSSNTYLAYNNLTLWSNWRLTGNSYAGSGSFYIANNDGGNPAAFG
ncbi:MAG: hypothetical protein ACR2IQ_00830, partial [Minisyncoccia bacterium]